jgi:CelD/BcsL family acetyltransferase involved in cellulose biosynthesis
LSLQVIETVEDFAHLQPQWEELLADSGANGIFLSHAWLMTWWETFGKGRRLRLLAVRDEGRLVAVAPLLLRTIRYYHLLPFRRLEFLASGEDEAHEIDSDYLDFILRSGWEAPALERIFAFLVAEAGHGWDEIVLARIPEHSPSVLLIPGLAEALDLRRSELQRVSGVVVSLPATWDDLLSKIGKRHRHELRRSRRLLSERGRLHFRWSRTADEFAELWPDFVALHQKRWQSRGQPGCFASPRFAAFHQRIGPCLASAGKARLGVLYLDETPLAACHLLVHAGTVYHYQSGLDVAAGGRSSPGEVLLGCCLEAAIGEGLRAWDFLGGMCRYKWSWSQQLQHQVSLRLVRRGFRETARRGLEASIQSLRRWRKK